MAMTPEGKVKKAVKDLLLTYKNLWYHFVANNGIGASGCPDILICYRGTFIAVEIKADKSKAPTALQLMHLGNIDQAGGYALVIHKDNITELKAVLDKLTGEKP